LIKRFLLIDFKSLLAESRNDYLSSYLNGS
jgi:hypothetical protein